MKGFDTEDLQVLKKSITSGGKDIMQCAPGPPMDLVEEDDSLLAGCSTMLPTLGANASRVTRNSSVRYSNSSRHNSQVFNRVNNNSLNSKKKFSGILNPDQNANSSATVVTDADGNELTVNLNPSFDDSGLIPQIDRPMSLPYLCCKMWRWRDLQVDAALHRLEPLPWCRFGRVTINNATVSCCNPYHYGLWIRPELTSNSEDQSLTGIIANGGGPVEHSLTNDTGFGDEITGTSHYRDFHSTAIISDDLPPTNSPPPVPNSNHVPLINHVETTTDGAPAPIHSHAIAWGKLARWERRERIGEMVPLIGQFIALGRLAGTVYDGQDVKHQWDLDNSVSFSLMKRVESEFYEDIWLYNSGEKPLFICLSHSHKSENIRRLSPGYCIKVHKIPCQPESTRLPGFEDPANSMSVLTISVGCGWGINYQRLYVTDMPCRYEIIFT
ncbi:hypothetical protein FO519_006907 [Halicephalobus sp. NKZ332]|nr:hypothetical protein FO519_006907 [Halicephalobus sp. NKZ332]